MTAELANDVPMVEHALRYLADEWSVFPVCTPVPTHQGYCEQHGPCRNPGKLPLVKWGAYQDRVPGKGEVITWWRKWPTANIGLATGVTSDIVVVDLDGEVAVVAADRYGYDPGPWVRTGRIGGRHAYFRYRPDAPTIFAKVGGIDFRGQGGFVLLPPSLHKNGVRYGWGEPVVRGEPLPDLPKWVDDLAATNERGLERGPVDFGKLLAEGVPEGQRDQDLFRAAAKLRGADVPYELAVQLIQGAAAQCSPPFDQTEAKAKVDSAYSRYQPNPPAPMQLFGAGTADAGTVVNALGDLVNPETGEVVGHRRFRFITAEELKNRPAPEYLVDGVVQQNTIAMIVGAQETFKSFVGLDLALSVGAGVPWAGHDTVQGTTAYISAEGGSGLGLRVAAWEVVNGPAEHCYFLADQAPQFLDRKQGGDVDELLKSIGDLPVPPCLIFVDTLARTIVGGDENSAQDMGVFIASAEAIRQATGATVVLVHHNNRGGTARGSSALLGAVHTIIECSRETNSPHVVVKCGKQKDTDHFQTMMFSAQVTPLSEGRTSLVMEHKNVGMLMASAPVLSKSAVAALDELASLGTAVFSAWRDRTGLSKTTFHRARAEVVQAGLVDHFADKYSVSTVGHTFRSTGSKQGPTDPMDLSQEGVQKKAPRKRRAFGP